MEEAIKTFHDNRILSIWDTWGEEYRSYPLLSCIHCKKNLKFVLITHNQDIKYPRLIICKCCNVIYAYDFNNDVIYFSSNKGIVYKYKPNFYCRKFISS